MKESNQTACDELSFIFVNAGPAGYRCLNDGVASSVFRRQEMA
jgi:hypothetical protein